MSYMVFFLQLVFLIHSYCIQEQHEIAKKANIAEDEKSVGNDRCRPCHECGFHQGTSYSWCATAYDKRDYCCISTCEVKISEPDVMECSVGGGQKKYCGNPGDITVKGTKCLSGHTCGMHNSILNYGYWCYEDTNENWEYCCKPLDTFCMKAYNYYWCRTGKSLNENDYHLCEPSPIDQTCN